MKKLIIQIPCYNEERSLPIALAELPRSVQGIDVVEWLIVDDGCTDNTVQIARQHGVDHVVRFNKNQGLAKGFMAGLDMCLKLGADVIVNTDADNQYDARDIEGLAAPVIAGEADMVIGARPIDDIEHFSSTKKLLQKVGSKVVRIASKTKVKDSTSGFRAISRDAAMRMNVFNEYTYTLETIIQAGQKNMAVMSIPIRTNEFLRPSRLISGIPSYIRKSVATIFRIFVVYKPFRFFMTIGVIILSLGCLLGIRFLYYFFTGSGAGHVQSLILASILIGIGFQVILTAFLSDLLSVNRRLMEDLQYRFKKAEYATSQSSEVKNRECDEE